MPCSGFNGGSIDFDTVESDFCGGAGDWAFPSPIICSPASRNDDDPRPQLESSDGGPRSQHQDDAVDDASLTATACTRDPQSGLMCSPHLDGAGNFSSTVPEMRDSSESKFRDSSMTDSTKMEVDDEERKNNGGSREEDDEDECGGVPSVNAPEVAVSGGGGDEEEEEEDELFFQPPRRISMLWNSKLRWKEERKKVLKISIGKLRRIEDPELSLCRAILINNTVKRLHKEIRDEKMARYPDVIRPVPMVTAYHLANCNNASIPEAFPRKRSYSTSSSSSSAAGTNSTGGYNDYNLDGAHAYCGNNDKENRNCSDSSVVMDYMNIDNASSSSSSPAVNDSVSSSAATTTTTPSLAKRARLTNAKSDTFSVGSETTSLMVEDYRNASDLRTATANASPLSCHQQQHYQTTSPFQTPFTTSTNSNNCSQQQQQQQTTTTIGGTQLLELSDATKNSKSDALCANFLTSPQRSHLLSLECCTKDEISTFSSRFSTSPTTQQQTQQKDKRDVLTSEYEKQYSQYSCGQFSIFGELQSVVFHSLITSLES